MRKANAARIPDRPASSRYRRSGGSGIKIMVPRAEKSSCGIMQLYPSHSTARMHSTKSTLRKSAGCRAGE